MDKLQEIVKFKFGLLKEYSNSKFSEGILRETSTLLRFLFIDNGGALQKLKNSTTQEYLLIETDKSFYKEDKASIFYQQGGGSKNGEISIQGTQIFNRAISSEEISKMYEEHKKLLETKQYVSLGQYFNTESFKIGNIGISKEFIIRFTANKLGGNHYDETRNHDKKGEERKMLLLDQIMNDYKILDENPVFIELMSIGQKLANDQNLNLFISKL